MCASHLGVLMVRLCHFVRIVLKKSTLSLLDITYTTTNMITYHRTM